MFNKSNLLNALQIAYDLENRSIEEFELSQTYKNNKILHDHYWNMCKEHAVKAQGMIDAYNIITGEDVYCIHQAIEDEMERLESLL